MKPTFKEVVKTEAYQKQAAARSKAHMFVATISALLFMFLFDFKFGFWWAAIFPALLFFSSMFIALPSMSLQIWLGLRFAKIPGAARGIAGLLDWIALLLNPVIIYLFLSALHRIRW